MFCIHRSKLLTGLKLSLRLMLMLKLIKYTQPNSKHALVSNLKKLELNIPNEMTSVASGVFLQILLVIVFGAPEGCSLGYFGNEWLFPGARLLNFCFYFLGDVVLAFGFVKNG